MCDGAAAGRALWAFAAPAGNAELVSSVRARRVAAGEVRTVQRRYVAGVAARGAARSLYLRSVFGEVKSGAVSNRMLSRRDARTRTHASSRPSIDGTEDAVKRSKHAARADAMRKSADHATAENGSVNSIPSAEEPVDVIASVAAELADAKHDARPVTTDLGKPALTLSSSDQTSALETRYSRRPAKSKAERSAARTSAFTPSPAAAAATVMASKDGVVAPTAVVASTVAEDSSTPSRILNAPIELQLGWAKKGKLSAWRRSLEIWLFFVQILLKELKLKKKSKEEKALKRGELAENLKKGLITLGPTFIKLGQLLSTRVDVVPKEYIDQLCELQDRVPGFSGERAKKIISEELQAPIEILYDSFDTEPIAAASLGQVHRAVYNGRDVVVKVQREGLRELFDMDLRNLKLLAVLLDKLDPKTDGADRDWVGIYDESAKLLYDEIDYELEARNARRFAENFADTRWIKVPEVFEELSSRRVLTLEYCPGVKVNDVKGITALGLSPTRLAQRSGESYLSQLLRYGYFHCDPHAGNIAVDTGYEGGRLIYYDFGMMAEIKPEVKRGLVELIFGVYDGSSREVCDALEKMGVLRRNVDRVSVEKIARFFLGAFQEASEEPVVGPDGVRRTDAERKEATRVKMQSRLSSIGTDLLSVSDDAPFKFPATFTFVFRAFTTLEGIGKSLDPSYDLTRIARPYLKELIDLKDGSATLSAIKAAQKRLGWRKEDIESVVTQPRRVAYISRTLQSMERGDLKLRVRVLESEQSFKRMTIVMETMGTALLASVFLNAAFVLSSTCATTALSVSAAAASSSLNRAAMTRMAKLAWFASFVAGLNVIKNLIQLKSLDKKLNRYSKS